MTAHFRTPRESLPTMRAFKPTVQMRMHALKMRSQARGILKRPRAICTIVTYGDLLTDLVSEHINGKVEWWRQWLLPLHRELFSNPGSASQRSQRSHTGGFLGYRRRRTDIPPCSHLPCILPYCPFSARFSSALPFPRHLHFWRRAHVL